MSYSTYNCLLTLDTDGVNEIIGITDQEVNQPPNEDQVEELFPEINVPQDHGSYEHVNENVAWLAPDLFWEKKITKALKGGNVLLTIYNKLDKK
ncbi:unnamed protein product [Vicia faba]|uniref:Uncharacterized protein n=1 Tax=Vicia faba TaxID=3906 RepID=A0AAV0ZNY7_VICFA|nr:unnamed protein product [Vicia faba]